MVKEIKALVEVKPGKLKFSEIPLFQYKSSLQEEIDKGKLNRQKCMDMLEQMLTIRAFEEMIAEIVAGNYKPLPKFRYIGPTHVSIGQEATSTGSINALAKDDYITSSHRGHGDAIAKGFSVINLMKEEELLKLLEKRKIYLDKISQKYSSDDNSSELKEKAKKVHIYRMIAELFGKADGYCRGVGGSMHIADFESGHLGANAIVGGHIGIATGAGMSSRYRESGQRVLCLAGDGAYSNGISFESINLASMAQFSNGLMKKKFGVPVIYAVVNNQYAMSGQSIGEVTGVDYMARRAAAFNPDCLHAEVVDGMDVLAVYDATSRALSLIDLGKGPILLEYMTYRYKGHGLSDPLSYRDRSETEEWIKRDPINLFIKKLSSAVFPKDQGGSVTKEDFDNLKQKVWERNAQLAVFAATSSDPDPSTLLDYMYAKNDINSISYSVNNSDVLKTTLKYPRNDKGEITYRLALREALAEEMARDSSVLLFGEDIAEYGGAFGVTKELLQAFGRDRVFNTSISESAIVGCAVGMAMTKLRPVCEIMYDDFILMAMDQIGNQAAKWSYMSGGQISVPMVLRTAIGGGRGYAGQHSQSLESITAHMPGLIVIAPSTAYDAKGLLKSAIRNNNPVIFFEHQLLYNSLGIVPLDEYTIPIGKADIKREGKDVTVISWSYMITEALKAAEIFEEEGISLEIIDIRTLIPLDIETIIKSVKKTNKVIIFSQPVDQGSFGSYISSKIMENAFDYLDWPVYCISSPNGVPPTAQSLEREFLPNAEKLVREIKEKFLIGA
ncbi:MAG: dehydrogenase E1 component subunit alpha/beta [Actinobacteria bacterium]|nr:dehydrogenase E1 component subunit alpha/beta [Actinomycetota bacterium]